MTPTSSRLQRRATSAVRKEAALESRPMVDNESQHDSIRPSKHTPKPIQRFLKSLEREGLCRPFRLLLQDLRHLSQRWPSDWLIFNQLVLASAVYVFFTNLLPGITFASDLYVLTGQNWGTIEVVLSTGLCGVVFSLLSVQPLTILGVTGPFSVLAENIYVLCIERFGIPFLPFMAWSLIHAGWMHCLLAALNAHDWTMRFVTTFSTEIFSLLNSFIYFHKAIQELQRAHQDLSFAGFLYATIGASGTMLFAMFLSTAESWKPLLPKVLRMILQEYAAAISIILFIGIPHIGELATLDRSTLAVSTSFKPTSPDRLSFLVPFWELPPKWIFGAMLPGLVITILFFFDHEVSSIICTIDRYGTRKSGGFAWDIVLLGLTTVVCGILGIPPSNGLLPQAPLHSESLMHSETEQRHVLVDGEEKTDDHEVRRVYEQRWSAFLHAAAILAFTAPPLQSVLGLTPRNVLAGLFLFMGAKSLFVNPVLFRFLYLLTPPSELPSLPPPMRAYTGVHAYTILQVLAAVLVLILTLTPAAPAFPVLIIALVPFRLTIMKKIWNRETLRFVDAWACCAGTPEDDEDLRAQAARSCTSNGPGEVGASGQSA